MSSTIPIIILNWNGIEDTLECINSLSEQKYLNFYIYLVDNGSDEENVRLLKKYFAHHPKIRLIFNESNLGFAKGNNAILRRLIAPDHDFRYIALLNNDTEVDSEWLQELVRCAEETGAGMVSSKMINYFDRKLMDNAGHKMLNTAEIIPIGHLEPVESFSERFENMGPCAGAALYSVEMLRQIGVFDRYFETGYEDAELGVRGVVLGYKSVFEPKAIVYHKISRSVNKVLNYNYLLKIQLNIFYSYFKLIPYPALLVSLPFVLFKYCSIIAIDILFFRWRFLKIMSSAIYLALFRERKKITESRREFFETQTPIPSFDILRKQEFFLWFDIRRFFKFIILNRPTKFERY